MERSASLYRSSVALQQHISNRCGTPDDPYRLTRFEGAIVASVLEDTIKELHIFMSCSNELQVAQALMNLDKLRALKYQVEQPAECDELADIDPRKLGSEEYKLKKLFADRNFICNVLDETYLNIVSSKNYEVLVEKIQKILADKSHREFLIQEECNNRLLKRDLNRQCRQQRNHIKSATYDADCTITQLRTKVEDAALNAAVRSRYVTNWQVARTEQHHHLINEKESSKETSIELFKQRFDQEQRVHAEIEMLTTIDTNDTLTKVEQWMEKYDKDIEAVDLKIQIMKNNHVVQKEQREHLEETIEEHDKLMKNWLKFKKDREDARLYREKMTNAAIVVQAWWRGILVRNQLGPYKPQPKKKGGKKK
ncbi:dynein regulatory complex protein 9 [Amyelois transitella]|uniref:dynein regulatory complex protein 9 n=1 Tax=Amyelois transitella TaxID=680683 RepID=UPI00299059AE|nr:dynein regulatory complex protein 9 [Amyelois transitella]